MNRFGNGVSCKCRDPEASGSDICKLQSTDTGVASDEEADSAERFPSNAGSQKETKSGDLPRCIACKTVPDDRLRSSWNDAEGKLCKRCWIRHKKHPVHCTQCGFIPTKNEWKKMEVDVKIVDGIQVFPCLECRRKQADKYYTVVFASPPEKPQDRVCLSCGEDESQVANWTRSWIEDEYLCSICGPRWKRINAHCNCCNLVPYKNQISLDNRGNMSLVVSAALRAQ